MRVTRKRSSSNLTMGIKEPYNILIEPLDKRQGSDTALVVAYILCSFAVVPRHCCPI